MTNYLKKMKRINSPQELEQSRKAIIDGRDPSRPCISICGGTGCLALGAEKISDNFKEELRLQYLSTKIDFKITGCPGFCERGPLVIIYPKKIFYQRVKIEDVPEIISETILNGKIIDRLLYIDPQTGEKSPYEDEVPFYRKQRRHLLSNNSRIDPGNIEDYLALGGYAALSKALFELSPEQLIEEIKESKIRGRGGGGFPTGRKWEFCRQAEGNIKYVICNCDEGDPGAFMDRSLMEGNPHNVLEGMIIGAYAIGAHEGCVYIRNEYPLAVKNVNIAIAQAEEYGFLGKNILGSGFDFTIKVNRGGGAFVCGEETALIASLEGKVGEPRQRPPYPAVSGLWGKPTNINNVETWANIPLIINNGANWFASIGTEGSKGTKIFSLVGKVNNTGLVEVPMGISLRDIIYKIGGGIANGKKFKAVQTGGPSGGCIPAEYLDTSVDYDELTKLGSIMGSGGMVVMDEDTCMVDVARYFLTFLKSESCGKCVPCREGIEKMQEILINICEGRGEEGDIDLLEELSAVVREGSLCALGATAPNPVLSTIRYFRQEYEAHIREKRCPAHVCKALISYSIIDEKCLGCGLCEKACPQGAITFVAKKKPVILEQSKCIKCGACYDVCKLDAVAVE